MRLRPASLGALGLALGLLLILSGAVSAAPALTLDPSRVHVGDLVTATGTGLEPHAPVRLVWQTNRPEWSVDRAAGTFNGIDFHEHSLTLAEGVTDARGRVELRFTVPEDFGYLHDVFLEYTEGHADSPRAARQGILVEPSISISPESGPAGTPIQVTIRGIGYRPYDFLRHLLYDKRYVGIVTAINTRGTARITITAVGEPGLHLIELHRGAYTAPYLNLAQSPNWIPGLSEPYTATFRITEGEAVVPGSPEAQQLPRLPHEAPAEGPPSGARLSLDYASGHVGDPLVVSGAGFPAGAQVQLYWSRVVGNRVSGQGWMEEWMRLDAVATDQNGNFRWQGVTPDDLGGPHTIRAAAAGASSGAVAEATYSIQPSVAAFGPVRVQPGETITLTLKGIGWTETENIVTMVHDNAYIGYACGFNSQGDITIYLQADPRPGWHFVELYPGIYKGDMGIVTADPFRLPMLNAADHPGAELPVFRLAYFVEE